MANTKSYKIVIDGIQQSVDAVKTLNQQLDALEQRIKNLEGKAVKVGTSTGSGGGGGNASALSEEEKLEKEILATEEKIAKVRSESYQKLLAAKEELKEATTYAKSQYAASENSQWLFDTNTMQGMKAQLKSIKQEMQTVDVNSDKFKQLTQQANELNSKLKEVEASYGQFGRNVGNYANGVAEGMQKVVIKVGDTERTFESAKQASRELGNELKNMAVNGQRGTKEYNDLDEAVRKLNSDLKDVSVSSQGMDKLMDSLQGVTALASTASGLKNLFGFDGGNVEQGIQKLVALQNVMKGIEEIRQQMKTEEGIGALITKGNDMVDKMVGNLTAMATNFLGVGKAAKVAATGVNVFGKALKAVIGMGIGFVIAEALEYVTDLIDGIKKWASGDADLIKAEDLVGIEVDKVNRKLEERLKLNEQLNTGKEGDDNKQRLADEQAYAEAIKESMELMDKELKLQDQIQAKSVKNALGNDYGVTTFGGFTRAIENVDDFIERYEALNDAVMKDEGLKMMKDGFEICSLSASDARDELAHLQQLIVGDYITAMKRFDLSTKEGVQQLKDFIAENDRLTNGIYSSALANMGNIIENSGLREALNNAKNLIGGFFDYVSSNSARFERTLQSAMNRANEAINNAGKTAEQLQVEQVKKYYADIRKQANEQGRLLTADELNQLDKGEQAEIKAIKARGASTSKAIKANGKNMADATRQVESELTNLRIEAMRDGLNKTIAQLEEEKRQRINKIRANGKDVAESVKLVEKIYADKVLEARKEFARKIEEQNKEIWDTIGRIDTDAQTTALQNMLTASENNLDKQLREYQARLKKIYSDYAPSLAGISTEALANAGNISAAVKQGQISKEDGSIYSEKELEGLKHMLDILEDIDYLRGKIYLKERQEVPVQNQYASEIEQLTKNIAELQEMLEKAKKNVADNTFSDDELSAMFTKQYADQIKSIREQFETLNQAAIAEENAMYERLRKMEQDNWDKEHEATTKRLQNELNALRGQKDAEIEATTEAYKKGEIDLKEHYQRNLAIQQKYAELAASKEEAIVDEQARIAEKYQQNLDNLLTAHNTKLKEIAGNTSDGAEAAMFDDYKSRMADNLKSLKDYEAEVEDMLKRNKEALAHYQELAASNVGIQFGGESLEELYKLLHEAEEARDKILRDNGVTEEQLKKDVIYDLLQEENYTRRLNEQFIARLGNHIKYYDEVEEANRVHWAKVLQADLQNLDIEYQQQVDAANKELEELKKKLDEQEQLELGSVSEEEMAGVRQKYLDQYLQAEEKTGELINAIWDKYYAEIKAKEIEYRRNVQTEVAKSQNNIISEYRDFYSKLSALQQEQPIQDAWGIVNMHQTRSKYRSIISGFTELSEAIIQQRRELQQKLAKNEITFDDFTQARRELNDLQTSVAQSLGDIENKSKNLIGDFMASINTYISAFGNAIQTVMQSLWDLEDYNFQKELDQIDDQNDALDKKLSEQEDIVKKHADAVNDIEDELATARGDRRQHLIDQLNAEMMAQRAALAEQKKIEKQKENLEKRQEGIEKRKKEAEYKRNLMSILVSNAMAVANALATQPFVPSGIAMGSLALALGAAQYAIAKKQKPYEHGGQLDGGVAVGKRHKDGGIPVLGGRAAIEGGEFITNRVTTAKNADLLSYINSKKKKVDVTDLLEFFKSEKTRKNITGVRTKFANGGIIPSVTTEFGNSLSNTIVVRDDSVYQVSVVDINNAQDNVKNVQVLAGL